MDELYIRLFGNKSKDIIFESSKINYVRVSRELINDYLKMVNNPKINKFISKKIKLIHIQMNLIGSIKN